MPGKRKYPSWEAKNCPKELSTMGSIPYWPNLGRLLYSKGGAILLAYFELCWPDQGEGVEVDFDRLRRDLQVSHPAIWVHVASIAAYHESLSAASAAKRSRREFYRTDRRSALGPWKAYSFARISSQAFWLRRNLPVLHSWLERAGIANGNLDTQTPRAAITIFAPSLESLGRPSSKCSLSTGVETGVHAVRAAAAALAQSIDPMCIIGGDRRRFTSAMNGGAMRHGYVPTPEAARKALKVAHRVNAERRKALKNIEADQTAFGSADSYE